MRVDKYRDHQQYVDFIESYSSATNAATGSKVDSNANVEHKTISTVQTEVPKKDNIKTNRLLMWKQLAADYGEPIAERYLEDLETHLLYKHDETSFGPYCASVTLYPFLLNGTKGLGGCSEPPKHLQSYVGGFINLIYELSAQLAGAVATPEFLPYFDYFCRKDYGENYRFDMDKVADLTGRTIGEVLDDYFQQTVYSINQPAGARGYQSVFWNVAYFDRPYFEGLFQDFCFPDGAEMNWDSVSWLQKRFMKWFNAERLHSASLTFPVESLSLLDDGKEYVDKKWADFAARMWAEGHSFFLYRSDNVDSLSSCCRLRNEIQDNQFSYTLGAGGISTGSKAVMTINFNRLVQTIHNNGQTPSVEEVIAATNSIVARVHLYLSSFNRIITHRISQGLLPIYDSGFINPDRQYLTVGINGLVEAAEFMGYTIKPDDARYCDFVNAILKCINDRNKADRAPGIMFNTEYVPNPFNGHVKPFLIDSKLSMRQRGASVMAA